MVKIALVNIIRDLECPPLTLAYLATYIKKYNNLKKEDIRIIDINFEEPLTEIEKFKPDIIGFSAHTIRFNFARDFARKLKQITNAKIVIGGFIFLHFLNLLIKDLILGLLGKERKLSLILLI
ncbi:MAG: cobalamin-dependent protein [Candidatus Nanoarchaeia archaeon]